MTELKSWKKKGKTMNKTDEKIIIKLEEKMAYFFNHFESIKIEQRIKKLEKRVDDVTSAVHTILDMMEMDLHGRKIERLTKESKKQ